MKNHRDLDSLLGKPLVVNGLALLLIIAVLAPIGWALWDTRDSNARQALRDRLGELELGLTTDEVLARAGAPDHRCGAPTAKIRELCSLGTELPGGATDFWIYRADPTSTPGGAHCSPRYLDSVLGFSQHGELVWFIRSVGESSAVGCDS